MMKTKMITELVKMEALPTTTDAQLYAEAGTINKFLETQDGFIDAELLKPMEENTCYFIYHIENMEKVKAVGEKIRARKLFSGVAALLEPGSMTVNFYEQKQTL